MNNRELFNAIMHYEDFDRMPAMHWAMWDETLEQWRKQGLPENIKDAYDPAIHDYFGTKQMGTSVAMIERHYSHLKVIQAIWWF